MAARDQIVIQSEADAWQHVRTIATRLKSRAPNRELNLVCAQTLEMIAAGMLRQLEEGVHMNPAPKANPAIAYGQALGGRIRGLLGDTPLVHRVTHGLMTSRLDTVKTHDAESLVKLLEQQGHQRTAGQFATFWNKHAVRGG